VTKILIADDHPVVRMGLMELISGAFENVTFGEAKTTQEALEQVWKHDWGLVILDISMPGRSGIDILSELKKARPKIPVLVLSMHPEEQFARRALKAGASAYMTKESVPEELIRALRRVMAGGRYVSGALAEKLAADLRLETEQPAHELLSDREFQVLRMIALGKTVTDIACELALSVKTVSTYRARIIEKTGMKNNAELIRYAIQNQLVG
jgi:two-component system, NarL family, invasion response regulator UvrY